MKTINSFIFIFFFFLSVVVYSQDYPGGYNFVGESEKENSKKIYPYFFLELKFPKMSETWGTEFGGGAGALFGKKFGIGVEYFSLLSNKMRVQVTDTSDYALGLGYGGMEFSYSFFLFDIMKISPAVMTGLARVTNSYENVLGVSNYSKDDWFFMLEPQVRIGVRLFKGVWFGFAAGWRMPFGLKYYNLGDKALSGPFFAVSVCSL
jgi:hypothetical protein